MTEEATETPYQTCRPPEGSPRCKLGQLRLCRTIQIQGRHLTGDGSATMFFIGEAPGEREDKTGRPFVGRAGEKLEDLLRKAGIPERAVFLTNGVRCRPPGNRTPTVQESKACSPHLVEELKHYQPKVIVLLGSAALRTFNLIGEGKITEIRGSVFRRKHPDWPDGPEFTIIPTFHPAALLHSPSAQREARVLDDLVLAFRSTGAEPEPNLSSCHFSLLETVADVEKVISKIQASGSLALDTESRGLRFRKDPMTCLSLCWSDDDKDVAIIPFYRHDPTITGDETVWRLKPHWTRADREKVCQLLKTVIENPRIEKLGFNLKYDMNVIRQHLGLRLKGRLVDAMLLHHLIDENPPHNLEYLLDLEYKTGDYSRGLREVVGHGDEKKTYDRIPDEILYPYTAMDVYGTFQLARRYETRVKSNPDLFKLYEEEVEPGIRAIAQMEWNGARIDTKNTKQLLMERRAQQAFIETSLINIVGYGFKPLSYPNLIQAIKDLGYESWIVDIRKPNGYDCSKNRLLGLVNEGGKVGQLSEFVLSYRTNRKMISTYLESALENVEDDGRLREGFKQHGTVSGRYSGRFYHQLPRTKEDKVAEGLLAFRHMVGADPGYILVVGDFDQIELRVLAAVTQDPSLLKIFAEGRDPHLETAAVCLGIPPEKVNKENRTAVGKGVNFGLIYGSDGYQLTKVQYVNPVTGMREQIRLDQVQGFMRNLRKTWAKVDEFISDTPHMARCNYGTLASVFGRERHLAGKLNDGDEKIRKHAEREALNFRIQSPAAAVANRTFNLLHEEIERLEEEKLIKPGDIRLTITLHDAIVTEVKKYLATWYRDEVLRPIAQRPIPELGNMSFPMSIGVGPTWADAELAAE